MSKWLNSFLQNSEGDADPQQSVPLFHEDFRNIPKQITDNTDRPLCEKHVSVLSVLPRELLCENLEELPQELTDNTDRPPCGKPVSVLSVPPRELLFENLEDLSQKLTDNTDRPPCENLVSVLSVGAALSEENFEIADLAYEFEERIAIAEYDGQQSTLQAQRIAYQDAFIVALTAIPHEAMHQANRQGNWFSHHVKESQVWLSSQGIYQPE